MTAVYRPVALAAGERRQIEAGLSAAFGLSAEGAAGWVETTLRNGTYYVCKDGDTVAGSFAVEAREFERGAERRRLAFLQSHFIAEGYRGRGWGVTRETLAAVCDRAAAAGVILSLYDEPLRRYWERLGFEAEQEAAVVSLDEYRRRADGAFTVVPEAGFLDEKVFETEAIGGRVERFGGMLALIHPGDEAITELLTIDPDAADAAARSAADARAGVPADAAGVSSDAAPGAPAAAHAALLGRRVRLRTVLTWPRRMGLFVPFDV